MTQGASYETVPENGTGILLRANLAAGQVNEMRLGDPVYGWFMADNNPSTGYSWRILPDNSGTVQVVQQIVLHDATGLLGAPGKIIWLFQARKRGTARVVFALYPPGGAVAAQTDSLVIAVR